MPLRLENRVGWNTYTFQKYTIQCFSKKYKPKKLYVFVLFHLESLVSLSICISMLWLMSMFSDQPMTQRQNQTKDPLTCYPSSNSSRGISLIKEKTIGSRENIGILPVVCSSGTSWAEGNIRNITIAPDRPPPSNLLIPVWSHLYFWPPQHPVSKSSPM